MLCSIIVANFVNYEHIFVTRTKTYGFKDYSLYYAKIISFVTVVSVNVTMISFLVKN